MPDPRTSVFFVAGVAVLFFWFGVALQMQLGERGLLAAEWLLLFVPALLFGSNINRSANGNTARGITDSCNLGGLLLPVADIYACQ